jgi:hypothetical protein
MCLLAIFCGVNKIGVFFCLPIQSPEPPSGRPNGGGAMSRTEGCSEVHKIYPVHHFYPPQRAKSPSGLFRMGKESVRMPEKTSCIHPVLLAKRYAGCTDSYFAHRADHGTALIAVVFSTMSCSITRTFDADAEGTTGKPCCSHQPALPSGEDPNDITTDALLKKNAQCFGNHVYSKSGLT